MTAARRALAFLAGVLGGMLLWLLMVAAVLAVAVGAWVLLDGAVR
jgi:hypothetical protein